VAKAIELLRGDVRSDATGRIVLLTDGQANVGLTSLPELAPLVTAEGRPTTTIGFGEHFDKEFLTALADAGRGNTYYCEGVDAAAPILSREFAGLDAVVATNVSVELTAVDEAVVGIGVLGLLPAVPVPGGVQVGLGDAYDEESREALFRIDVPGLRLRAHEVADVAVRWAEVGQEVALHEVRTPVVVNVDEPQAAADAGLDDEVVERVVLLEVADAGRRAREAAGDGDGATGARLLRDAADKLTPYSDRPDIAERLGRLHRDAEALAWDPSDPATRKRLHFRSLSTYRGRSLAGEDIDDAEE